MTRLIVIAAVLICAASNALAEPQQALGSTVYMIMATTVPRPEGQPLPNFLYTTLDIPSIFMLERKQLEPAGEFSSHADLLTYFQSLPPSVRENGLWVYPTAWDRLWAQSDKDKLQELTFQAQSNSVLLFVCPLIETSFGKAEFTCKKVSP